MTGVAAEPCDVGDWDDAALSKACAGLCIPDIVLVATCPFKPDRVAGFRGWLWATCACSLGADPFTWAVVVSLGIFCGFEAVAVPFGADDTPFATGEAAVGVEGKTLPELFGVVSLTVPLVLGVALVGVTGVLAEGPSAPCFFIKA